MTFWIVAGVLALVAALAVGRALLSTRPDGTGTPDGMDIRIYRDQLSTVEKDLARGLVTDDEAERLRTEIKRRILEADRAKGSAAEQAPRNLTFGAAITAGIVMIGGSFWVYQEIGAPGYPDLPIEKRFAEAEKARKERPTQAELEADLPVSPPVETNAEYAELVEKLRAAVKERPDELEGWVLLARNEAQLGNLPQAHAAQRRVIELKGDEATSQDFTTYAALLVQSAGGVVSRDADWALNGALSRDPRNQIARYYAGLMHLQTGRPDQTFQFWESLLREGPATAPWIPIIRGRLESVAAMAGIKYTLPPDAALASPHGEVSGGPTQEDIAAAAEMSPEERQEFIRSMVDQLGQRMAEEGGPPSDWAKLIRAHGILGNTDRAAAIWAEAQQTFADPADLAPIREAAAAAGVAEETAPELRGPTQDDIDAAAEMTEEERDDSVEAMVDQLMERLATEGGAPAEWAMLIRSLGVIGDTDRAAAIWAEAQQRFEDPEHIELLRAAARAAGVAEPSE